ncbi:hypothetical protein LXL04_009088 [Taraxacum kok-saghyz]
MLPARVETLTFHTEGPINPPLEGLSDQTSVARRWKCDAGERLNPKREGGRGVRESTTPFRVPPRTQLKIGAVKSYLFGEICQTYEEPRTPVREKLVGATDETEFVEEFLSAEAGMVAVKLALPVVHRDDRRQQNDEGRFCEGLCFVRKLVGRTTEDERATEGVYLEFNSAVAGAMEGVLVRQGDRRERRRRRRREAVVEQIQAEEEPAVVDRWFVWKKPTGRMGRKNHGWCSSGSHVQWRSKPMGAVLLIDIWWWRPIIDRRGQFIWRFERQRKDDDEIVGRDDAKEGRRRMGKTKTTEGFNRDGSGSWGGSGSEQAQVK